MLYCGVSLGGVHVDGKARYSRKTNLGHDKLAATHTVMCHKAMDRSAARSMSSCRRDASLSRAARSFFYVSQGSEHESNLFSKQLQKGELSLSRAARSSFYVSTRQ